VGHLLFLEDRSQGLPCEVNQGIEVERLRRERMHCHEIRVCELVEHELQPMLEKRWVSILESIKQMELTFCEPSQLLHSLAGRVSIVHQFSQRIVETSRLR